MCVELRRIAATDELSQDVAEIVHNALAMESPNYQP
jgi:hypothetical protein